MTAIETIDTTIGPTARDAFWSEVERLLAAIPDRQASLEMRRRLTANLDSLRRHRPEIHQILVSAPPDDRYVIGISRTREFTICFRHSPGKLLGLSPRDDPLGNVNNAMRQLQPPLLSGMALALAGIGDGYLLNALAHYPPKLYMDKQSLLWLLEPEPAVLLRALMLHDYTGPAGPIEQRRIRWHMGPRMGQSLIREFLDDSRMVVPLLTIKQSIRSAEIDTAINVATARHTAQTLHWAREVTTYYQAIQTKTLAEVLLRKADRPPRVLIQTTRLSIVLQYSSRDAAEALEQRGCQTKLLIESEPYHVITREAMLRELAEFKPDLVLQIDHLRDAHEGIFPPQLPFVTWIQDNLPALTNIEAGASLGMRDFVLSSNPSIYEREFGYPKRQLIAIPQLGRAPRIPEKWTQDGDDLIYVSNWSSSPQEARQHEIAHCGDSPQRRHIIDTACQLLLDQYATGQCCPTPWHVKPLLKQAEEQTGQTIEDPLARRMLLSHLYDYFNNTLYRQQAIAWAAEIAGRMGLKLGLYGRGWDKHPQFANLARGFVPPGPAAEELFRRTKINLQLEPYPCFTHARMVGGVMAGGFFLVRDHPYTHLLPRWVALLSKHLPNDAVDLESARRLIAPEHHAQLEALADQSACITESVDPIAFARACRETGQLSDDGEQALPRLNEISFHDASSLAMRIERFVQDRPLRGEISRRQRGSVEGRLSYAAGMGRMLAKVGELIAEEATNSTTGVTR